MKKKNIVLFISATLILFLFVFFSYLVHKDLFTQFDFNATVRLQDNIPRRFDEIFSLLSFIGSFEPMALILIAVLVFIRKFRGIIVLGFFALFHAVEIFGKVFVNHLPPPEFMIRTERLLNFPQFHVRSEFSYPSGHAGRNIFLSLILLFFILRFKKLSFFGKWGMIGVILVFDISMLVSRVYLGEHWSSDVIGGIILGTAMALFGLAVY